MFCLWGLTENLSIFRDLCVNMNNHQKSTFTNLVIFLNPAF
ncbi:hypothetical protein [uncultured Gammaproteobacteria bacterium]|nr:hypothetical protein [uncultured Gammaproteobacteria bacterium]